MRNLMAPLATLIVGLALGIGTVAVAEDSRQPARTAADPVVRELKNIGRKLDIANRHLASVDDHVGDIAVDTDGLGRKLDVLNGSLGGYASLTAFPSVRALLQDIERNTSR